MFAHVYAEPVRHGDTTVIPVAKVAYGFGAGSGRGPAPGSEANSNAEAARANARVTWWRGWRWGSTHSDRGPRDRSSRHAFYPLQ